ncbi:MAG: hypothetical protein KC501_15535 [Myxococcales bacterium]|nr:hypothetical protein [Myxococcales bacterium]
MSDEIQRSMSPEQAAAGRERYLRELVLPYVRRGLARAPELRSAMLLVAQYWCDEADDAVHGTVVFSVLDEPDLDAARACGWDEPDEVNTPGRRPDEPSEGVPGYIMEWDDNGEAISLFAAFCEEDCHQEMDFLEAYTPYAVFRRRGDEVVVEVVGKKQRPWLDGVMPEWMADAEA